VDTGLRCFLWTHCGSSCNVPVILKSRLELTLDCRSSESLSRQGDINTMRHGMNASFDKTPTKVYYMYIPPPCSSPAGHENPDSWCQLPAIMHGTDPY
jgi:hypothetical protein